MRLRALWIHALAVAVACSGKSHTPPTGPGAKAVPVSSDPVVIAADAPPGLHFELSEGGDLGGRAPRLPVPPATALDDARTEALLARLPAVKTGADDEKAFAMRERSLPPPRTGETIPQAFPPPPSSAKPPTAGGGALEVLRVAPEGEVPLAPHISVTFDQPMVAVTSHDHSVAGGVPVKVTPEPPGKWRWVGTRTLLFDPATRLPMATEYTIEIPAGTESAIGGKLASAKRWTFATPPVTLQSSWPNHGPHGLQPVMFARFDQKIDGAAVLDTVEVKAGSKTYRVRAATADEIAADATVKNLVAAAERDGHADRWVAFRVDAELPKDTVISIVIGPGTPSGEGPRVTTAPQSFSFRTYAPLRVVEARCSYYRNCPPGAAWFLRFNNQLDPELFDGDTVAIAPELPGRKLDLIGDVLYVRGASKGRTRYTVTLPAALTDTFGQQLGRDEDYSFEVGSAEPTLWGPDGFVVLDPAAKAPQFSVFSINHAELQVRAYAVTPKDWRAFETYMRDFYRSRTPPTPPGKRVLDHKIKVEGETDQLAETVIDLSKALPDGRGHVIVTVMPTVMPRDMHYVQIVHGWYQATDIGLDAFSDDTELYAWATDLSTGAPLSDVALAMWPSPGKATTNADGLGTIPLPATPAKGTHVLIATRGDDTALLPENNYYWGDHTGWKRTDPQDSLRWFVFDDRAMYRPAEEVHVKGWIRRLDNRKGGDFVALAGAASTVSYRVVGPQGNELHKGSTKLTAAGGFDLAFKLPKTPNLGWARIEMSAVGKGGEIHGRAMTHAFQIQEFRRPEFEVTTEVAGAPHLIGGGADVTVNASYFAGGGLPGAETHWFVNATPASFSPPNRDDYTFGTWVPWWSWRYPGEHVPDQYKQLQGKTDASGAHHLHIAFLSAVPPRAMSVSAQATVMDVNRQAWSSTATLLVHPADVYVGLKSEKMFVERGKPIEIEAIVVDLDGAAVAGRPVTMRAARMDWRFKNGTWIEEEENPQECALESKADPLVCKFDTDEGGRYKITAVVTDGRGRRNETQLWRWVSGGGLPPARDVELEQVMMIPDKKEYAPGDVAQILLQAPFYPAEALVSYRRSGIVHTDVFRIDGPSTTLPVTIRDEHTPNLHVHVELVGASKRLDDDGKPNDALPKRPAYAKGELNLSIPAHHRSLRVTAKPKATKLEPGAKTKIDVEVLDAAGKPVPDAELAVVVVDEAVLALSGYQMPDPIDVFYFQRGAGVQDYHLRGYIKLVRPEAGAFGGAQQEATGAGAGGGGGDMADGAFNTSADEPAPAAAPPPAEERSRAPAKPKRAAVKSGEVDATAATTPATGPIAVRMDFNALATFAPAVRTDARGRATVDVKVPDNLTRYRVMVVGVAGNKQFGKGESSITARMPLMVRPSPPRFLNFGDRFELPVVVQNQTDAPMKVEVAVRATNAALTKGGGRAVTVPANDRVEVRFPATTRRAGTARFQIAAASGKWADAAELSLPVWTPATTEAFAVYGEIDKGAIRQPVEVPPDVVLEFGGLELTTSSTQLQALTDAVLYLVQYPFDSSEAMASRLMAIAALRDVLGAFEAEGLPSAAELEAVVARDLEDLAKLQNWDGGFSWWRRGDESWPYISIHAAHALARAKAKGYAVPKAMTDRSLQYLRAIRSHIPHWYPLEARWSLEAYALSVRKRLGDSDPARARELLREATLKKLPMEAVGWLLHVMSGDSASASQLRAIHEHLENRVSETAATAAFTTSYTDGAHLLLHSSRRTDAIILEALIDDKPKSDLIPKVTRGLLAHRVRGKWSNTQENAFVLLAMDRYFHEYEGTTPNFVMRAWLGDGFAGEQKFAGRSTDYNHIDVPMSWLAAQPSKRQDLVLEKKGKGRLYYRIGMRYAPSSLKLEPADHGFAVTREYEAVDDPGDVKRAADGTWRIKAGARVRVRLIMVAESRRYHVALVDPLPAGLEPMNPALAVTGTIPADPKDTAGRGRYWWWWSTWYQHQNLRDERAEAFTTMLWEGVHTYTYVTRATTPGTFIVPPTKAEEMYFPETFGRSASDKVVVED